MPSKISIIGPGNLGLAMAVNLCKEEHIVCLAGAPDHPGFLPEIDRGELIHIDGTNGLEHEKEVARVKVIIGDIEKAVQSEIIFVTVPISAQEDVIKILSSYNLSGRIMIFMPCGIAAGLLDTYMGKGCMPDLILGTVSSPYASRGRGNGKIAITRVKNQLEIAAAGEVSQNYRGYLQGLFPQKLVWYPNLSSIFFSNVNPVIHPATMLVSRKLIANSEPKPLFYEECMPAAEERMLHVDKERCALAEALKLHTKTLHEFFCDWYTPAATSYMNSVHSTPTYKGRRAPSFHHRYLTEDAKYLMVLMLEIAGKAGVSTPNFKWIIDEASIVLGEDVRRTGKTLRSVNLEYASTNQIVAWINGTNYAS